MEGKILRLKTVTQAKKLKRQETPEDTVRRLESLIYCITDELEQLKDKQRINNRVINKLTRILASY